MKQTKRILLGVGAALAVYLALLALLALLAVRGILPEPSLETYVRGAMFAAAFAGALTAGRGEKPALALAVFAVLFWTAVPLFGFVANDALDPARAASLVLPVLAGGALAYLLAGRAGRRKRERRGRRNRKRG